MAAVERARQAFAVIDGVLDVRPRIARLTLQADSATWTRLGRTQRGQVDLALFRRRSASSSNGARRRLRARQLARREREFAEADRIRGVLEERGLS